MPSGCRGDNGANLAISTLLALFLTVLLTGCGASETPGGTEPQIDVVPMVSSSGQVSRPILSYLPSVTEVVQLYRGYLDEVNECTGSPAQALPESVRAFAQGARDDVILRSDLYGFYDTESQGLRGYDLGREQGVFSLDIPVGATPQKMAECIGQINDASALNIPSLLSSSLTSLPDGGPVTPLSDSRYAGVVNDWAECMESRGHAYSGPLEALGDQRWVTTASEGEVGPSQIEVEVAVADIACKNETNLVGVSVALQEAYDSKYISGHQLQLEKLRQDIDAALLRN